MKFLVFGLRRSGNHYIIYWLLQNLAQRRIEEYEILEEATINDYGIRHDSGLYHPKQRIYFYNNCYPQFELVDEIDSENIEIFSFEDIDLTTVPMMWTVDYFILVLRCPLNLIASHYKRQRSIPRRYEYLIPIYQCEFLNETNFLPNKVCVNYNRFNCDRSYLRNIADRMSLDSTFDVNVVPHFGGGSSFEKTDFNKLNDLNTRYEKFLDDTLFNDFILKLANQFETVRRTEEIFGYNLLNTMNLRG